VSGRIGVMKQAIDSEVHFGVWLDDPCALIWVAGEKGMKKPLVKRAPSWSWAALDGCLDYRATLHDLYG